jgi:hypothetical protein
MEPMKPGEYRYAVTLREGSDLWVALWVKRSKKGEWFVMVREGTNWDVHNSYHCDGTKHLKSYNYKLNDWTRGQRLDGTFRGTESLGAIGVGWDPKNVREHYEPEKFSGVMEVPPDVLCGGTIIIDLVEPNFDPPPSLNKIVMQIIFCDVVPWLVIRIAQDTMSRQRQEILEGRQFGILPPSP